MTGRCPTLPRRPTQPICPAPTNPPSIRLARWSCRSPPGRRRGSACAPRFNPGPRAGVGAPRGWCASWGRAAWSLLAYVSRRLVRLDSYWTQAYYGGKPEATLVIPWRSSDRSDGSSPPILLSADVVPPDLSICLLAETSGASTDGEAPLRGSSRERQTRQPMRQQRPKKEDTRARRD